MVGRTGVSSKLMRGIHGVIAPPPARARFLRKIVTLVLHYFPLLAPHLVTGFLVYTKSLLSKNCKKLSRVLRAIAVSVFCPNNVRCFIVLSSLPHMRFHCHLARCVRCPPNAEISPLFCLPDSLISAVSPSQRSVPRSGAQEQGGGAYWDDEIGPRREGTRATERGGRD